MTTCRGKKPMVGEARECYREILKKTEQKIVNQKEVGENASRETRRPGWKKGGN